MRHSTIRSALVVAMLAATGCSLLPTMEGPDIQARRRSAPTQQQPPAPPAAPAAPQSTPASSGSVGVIVNQVNKVTYYMDGGKSTSGYLGIGTSVAQLNAMLNISVTDSSNVHFSQVNKVNILHDDDEHPEGGNREVAEAFMGAYLVFGDAVEQVNVMQNVTINNASNIRVDQVNKISLVDSAGRGRDGYLIFPQAGLTEQLNVLDATITNSTDVRFDQINSIFIIDADDFKDLYRSTESEQQSYLRRQYQSRMRYEQANGKSRIRER